MNETTQRDSMVRLSRSLFERGYTPGSSGNISVKLADGYLITPTNSCLGFLDAARISRLDREFRHIAGDPPSKEVFLHRAFYETRAEAGAVVHLHSTYATALSCLEHVDADDAVPALTPYVVMRVGRVKRVAYIKPGDPKMGDHIKTLGGRFAAVLLANHGPVVSGRDLEGAVYAAEELEETAKLVLLLDGKQTRPLSAAEIAELEATFGRS